MSQEGARESAPTAIATLKSILDLEVRRGYDDRAVVGGLAALLERIGAELDVEPELRARTLSYASQGADERALVVSSLRKLIEHPTPSAQPSGPPPDDEQAPTTPLPDPPSPSAPVAQTTPTPRAVRPRTTAVLKVDDPINRLPNVGPTRAKRLGVLGLTHVGDLRRHLPNRYLPYPKPQLASELGFQHLASFEGLVTRVDVSPLPAKRLKITAILSDSTGSVAATWFRGGGVPSEMSKGVRLAVSGPLVRYGRQIVFENPEYELASAPPLNTRRIVPVYPLTEGISQQFIRGIVRYALANLPPEEEWLPEWMREAEGLMDLDDALGEVHAPTDPQGIERARLRLSFDELLPMQLLVLRRRRAYQLEDAVPIEVPWGLLAEFRSQLPFALTGAQQRVLSSLLGDMSQPRPMVRLLQGEVGSGKTVVAAMLLLAAIASGGQGAIMAPTEILAEQHFRTLSSLYERAGAALEHTLGHPLRLTLLRGALTRKERQEALAAIAAGEVDLVVGTHAVIQSDVEFARLLLAVVDEQHRFGVNQRIAVRRKGESPHLLVMTATPIPRTLALTLFGDLDISRIDEMPAGRQPVETVLLRPLGRSRAYTRIRAEVAEGHQAFVVCPLVEGSANIEAKAAVDEYERLNREDLAGLRLALLHGRMRPQEKDDVMTAFERNEFDVLVSTSVVEVGVDIPNATAMVIEGAERFGLAQLHQFRGRIGRGTAPSVCFLIAGNEAPESLERLEAVVRSTNGLELAEEDLRLRGPGDFFGLRQSGLPTLQIARLTDADLVDRVRRTAATLLDEDPLLTSDPNRRISELVQRFDVTEAN